MSDKPNSPQEKSAMEHCCAAKVMEIAAQRNAANERVAQLEVELARIKGAALPESIAETEKRNTNRRLCWEMERDEVKEIDRKILTVYYQTIGNMLKESTILLDALRAKEAEIVELKAPCRSIASRANDEAMARLETVRGMLSTLQRSGSAVRDEMRDRIIDLTEKLAQAERDKGVLRGQLERTANYLESATNICEENSEDEENIRDSREQVAAAREVLALFDKPDKAAFVIESVAFTGPPSITLPAGKFMIGDGRIVEGPCEIPGPRTDVDPEWLRTLEKLRPVTAGPNAALAHEYRLVSLLEPLDELRRVVLSGTGEAEVPRAVLEFYNTQGLARPFGLNLDAMWMCSQWYSDPANGPEKEFRIRTDGDVFFTFEDTLISAIDAAGAEILATHANPKEP